VCWRHYGWLYVGGLRTQVADCTDWKPQCLGLAAKGV
jgi:hypothetical protein